LPIQYDCGSTNLAFRKKLSSGQEVCTYYSEQCICDLGVNGAVLCDHRSCGICMAVKSSFNKFAFGVTCNTGR